MSERKKAVQHPGGTGILDLDRQEGRPAVTLVLAIWLALVASATLAHRLYVRRPMTATDVWCAQVDADLDARATPSVPVVAERRAA